MCRYTIQWHQLHSQCCATVTISIFQNFSSFQTESIYLLTNSFPLPPIPACCRQPYSIFCSELDYSGTSYWWHHKILVCAWLSRFIDGVAYFRISFLFMAE